MPEFNRTTYLLGRLDQAIDHIRNRSQWVLGLVITFATGIVLTENRNLIDTPAQRIEITAVLALAVIVHWKVLARELRHIDSYKNLLVELNDQQLKLLIEARADLKDLAQLVKIRTGLVAGILAACWIALTDADDCLIELFAK